MKSFYYVFNPLKSPSNNRHKTFKEAQDEAERLSLKHGCEVQILKCVAMSNVSAVSTTLTEDSETGQDEVEYRILNEGEQIQDGDEINRNGRWERIDDTSDCAPLLKCNVGRVRRPL